MIEIKLRDFSGEIEWVELGRSLNIDKTYRALQDLINLSLREIGALASVTHNKPINEREQIPLLKSLLEDLKLRYEQLYISNACGDYFNADGQKENILDRSYFHEVMRGETIVSEPIINKSTKRSCIAVATPIWNDERIIGLFGATIPIDSMFSGLRVLPIVVNGRILRSRKRLGKRHGAGAKNLLMNVI